MSRDTVFRFSGVSHWVTTETCGSDWGIDCRRQQRDGKTDAQLFGCPNFPISMLILHFGPVATHCHLRFVVFQFRPLGILWNKFGTIFAHVAKALRINICIFSYNVSMTILAQVAASF